MNQPRDSKGRFRQRYVRPPRKGTIERAMWDMCNEAALEYLANFEKSAKLIKLLAQKGTVKFNHEAQ